MKKFTLTLLCSFFLLHSFAHKVSRYSTLVGLQIGFSTPVVYNQYGITKYKLGLPSFSYSASVENKLSINNKLNFTLQYSLTFFSMMQQRLQQNIINYETQKKAEAESRNNFSTAIQTQLGFKIRKDMTLVGGVGVSKPVQFFDIKTENKKILFSETANGNKFTPTLNPFFIIGLENSCKLFNRNLIYSIQYNIGFMPYRNMPLQQNNSTGDKQYLQGITLGLKYKY